MAAGPVLELNNISMTPADAEMGMIRSMNLSLNPGDAVFLFRMRRWERRTLIDLISALEKPEAGKIRFKEASLEDSREFELNVFRGRMGIVTQRTKIEVRRVTVARPPFDTA